MSNYTKVQAWGFYSNANAPSTIGGPVTSTVAGNLLVYFVTTTSSGTPTISSPGGSWQTLYNANMTGLAYACFYQLSNAGSITNVSCNLSTTTAGGAVGEFYELSLGNNFVLPANNFGLGANTVYTQSTTTIPWTGIPTLTNFAELIVYTVHQKVATFTNNNSPEWGIITTTSLVSTGSTTNAQQLLNFGTAIETLGQPQGGGTLSSAVASALGYVRFTSALSYPIDFNGSSIGGSTGVSNPNFFCGMVGG